VKILILAAGRGSRMGSHTEDKPKCLTVVRGRTLLESALEACYAVVDKSDVVIIGGYKYEMLEGLHSQILVNNDWASTNIMGSLMLADGQLTSEDCIVMYSDILFDPKDLMSISSGLKPAVLSVSNWREVWGERFSDPTSDLESFETSLDGTRLTGIGKKVDNLDSIHGQFGGIFSMTPEVWGNLKGELENLSDSDATSALSVLVEIGIDIGVVKTRGDWAEFDTISDIETQARE